MALRLALLLLIFIRAAAESGGSASTDAAGWGMSRASDGRGDLLEALRACEGDDVGECKLRDEEEKEAAVAVVGVGVGMEEAVRRSLAAARRFISYGALSKNRVPCSRRGRSYYNCASRGKANPYRRGCSAITNCARDLR